MKKNKFSKILSFILAVVIILSTFASAFVAVAYAESGKTGGGSTSSVKESIMKGFSGFKYKVYEWADSLTVGKESFDTSEKIYNIKGKNSGKRFFWTDDSLKEEMTNFYSSTDWHKFFGMQETVEISNNCSAILTDEVAVYADLMDAAAEKYKISAYKEIFKAIAQTRFNEYQKEYESLKSKGYIKETGDDMFDLFHIDGSWIDGGGTPVSSAPVGGDEFERPFEDGTGYSSYTVNQSIDIAARAFAAILEDTVYPSPYRTEDLLAAVQSFEFGGSSDSIQKRFKGAPVSLPGITEEFVSFEQYFYSESISAEEDEFEPEEVIESYAKVIAYDKTRGSGDTDTYGKYKYSDQKFYEKVFQNYQCAGGGSIDYGNLPADLKELLRKCIKTWDSRVTEERRAIIQAAVNLYGVTYSMDYRNQPSIDMPQYLDCSSFVGQAYWRAGIRDKSTVHWCTGSFASDFIKIDESQLIPGDIAQKTWNPGGSGGSEHIGIYIGTVDGVKYYIHCRGGYQNGIYHAPGLGVTINNYSGFIHFGRDPLLK